MWPSSSAALFTVTALCPAPTSAVANRSRTNAVSSATMTVLLLTGLIANLSGSRYNPNFYLIVIVRSVYGHLSGM